MDDYDLPPTDEVFRECPRFRILLLGKTGAGKTSLIKRAFNVDHIQESNLDPGVCNISDEIMSEENEHFIAHDSQGFEPGESKNFETVKAFIAQRQAQPALKDRLHAIWHCIPVPHAGGRIFETGDENFHKFMESIRIPIIVVFTQYDRLYSQIALKTDRTEVVGMDDEEIEHVFERKSKEAFKEFVKDLRKINPKLRCTPVSNVARYCETYSDLISMTSNLVRDYVAKTAWYAAAVSQRADVDLKVEASVELGMKRYWRKLSTSHHFDGRTLRYCFEQIQREVIDVWNFNDADKILSSHEFMAMILRLVHDLSTLSPSHAILGSTQELDKIKDVLDALAGNPVADPITPDPVKVNLRNWLSGVYQKKTLSPSTLCTLMGFIVDLTMTLERLFWNGFRRGVHSLTMQEVQTAYGEYYRSEERTKVHQEIRSYATSLEHKPKGPDDAEIEVKRLIETYRFVESHKPQWDMLSSNSGGKKHKRRPSPCQII
ncbi:hypothetical protein BOTBODRAFT_185702 [Botryobasidium botryosum FD-172 SS1]|uniref:G domain-containing protein n=1 Tax=Botryobasidium botryosum (strain FD-172 SS1) TaxID=930990 RepID=A0A067MS62_BOTB1|nr:hypothetical protein BOTBODRAFT_185702 [Botryobasidium botryosum FD-172 SS1]